MTSLTIILWVVLEHIDEYSTLISLFPHSNSDWPSSRPLKYDKSNNKTLGGASFSLNFYAWHFNKPNGKWLKSILSLCLIKHQAMKTDEEGEVSAPSIFNFSAKFKYVVNFTFCSL
jgi:hypothetical protein